MSARDPRGFPVLNGVPEVDTPTMIEVDRLMIEDYGVALVQMMENAGRCLATLARARLPGGSARGRRVIVLAGPGGNGGGALAAARRLACWGAEVFVALARPEGAMTPVPRAQLATLDAIAAPPRLGPEGAWPAADAILDGLIGYSLAGPPEGVAAALILRANAAGVPILSLDVPSGFDATSGVLRPPAIAASATLTLALPKRGLGGLAAAGDLYLADISVPPALYARLAVPLAPGPLFAEGDIVRLLP